MSQRPSVLQYDQRTFFGPPNSDDEELSRGSVASPDSDVYFSPPPAEESPKAQSAPILNGRSVYLQLLRQPEEQHRARYMSEGSRGAIKGRHGKGHCTVQLVGYNRPTRLEVYAGTGAGEIAPHLLYRLIPVVGKGGGSLTTPCKEMTAKDGLNCVHLTLRPDSKMTAVLDCVGILKICGHEMRRRVAKTERNTSIRLVFRAYVLDEATGVESMIQALSDPVSCVQQLGFPEVQRLSLTSDSVRGGSDLFILGKNFDKNTKVIFREWDGDGSLVWISEARIDKTTLHQCHLVCEVPTYKSLHPPSSVEVSMSVECGKKTSHPLSFTFNAGSESEGKESVTSMTPMTPMTPVSVESSKYSIFPATTAQMTVKQAPVTAWADTQGLLPLHHHQSAPVLGTQEVGTLDPSWGGTSEALSNATSPEEAALMQAVEETGPYPISQTNCALAQPLSQPPTKRLRQEGHHRPDGHLRPDGRQPPPLPEDGALWLPHPQLM